MAKFYIGTAGWSYTDWVPTFYPKAQTTSFDWLNFYSSYFNTVEVNATYYAYLSPKTAEGWVKKTENNDEFKFTIKLHQDFTHKKLFTSENTKAVIDNLNILCREEKFGGLLCQFPYSFGFNEASVGHIKRLKEIFNDYKLLVDVRHASWNKGEIIKYFKEADLSFCVIDQPQISKSISFNPVATNDILYVHLHGRNVKAWYSSIQNFNKEQTYAEQSARYDYLYSPSELIEIRDKIKEVKEEVKTIYIIFNNHPKGSATANAFEMIQLLKEKLKNGIPDTVLKSYPRIELVKK
ncbi:MAG: DUF72 domain-containing protein [Ignavibacteriaceae bacterium]|nr:DUF72 domain-containing protein [Ignavibacteriaceae bacterium]